MGTQGGGWVGKTVSAKDFGDKERVIRLEARVAELERLLQFTNGDPNYLIEHRKRVRGEISASLRFTDADLQSGDPYGSRLKREAKP